jgi:hypothetical protein
MRLPLSAGTNLEAVDQPYDVSRKMSELRRCTLDA